MLFWSNFAAQKVLSHRLKVHTWKKYEAERRKINSLGYGSPVIFPRKHFYIVNSQNVILLIPRERGRNAEIAEVKGKIE